MTIEEKVKEDLKLLALTDFEKFLKVTGVDMQSLIICEKKKRDNSIRQIAQAMQMNYGKVFRVCRTCPD